MGFPVPLKEWMHAGPVKEFVSDILLSQTSKCRGIYNIRSLEEMNLILGLEVANSGEHCH